MNHILCLLLGMMKELDLLIVSEGKCITLHQVLMASRSRICYKCILFFAINKHSVTGNIVVLCHSRYEDKAREIITNLIKLYKKRFGQESSDWFTMEAVKEATKQVFNQVTNTIEDGKTQMNQHMVLLEGFGHHTIELARVRALVNGEPLSLYGTGFDSDKSSDDKSDSKTTTVFDLQMLFQLKPSTERESWMDDHNSIGTRTTKLTNSTTDIY